MSTETQNKKPKPKAPTNNGGTPAKKREVKEKAKEKEVAPVVQPMYKQFRVERTKRIKKPVPKGK